MARIILLSFVFFVFYFSCTDSGPVIPPPTSAWLQADDLPDGTPRGREKPMGFMEKLTGAVEVGKGGSSSPLGAGLSLLLVVVGGVLLYKRWWGFGAVLATLGLVGFALQFGVHLGFRWFTFPLVVWVALWAYALNTPGGWDNYFIYIPSVAFLFLSALGQVMGFGFPGITWGAMQALLAFGVATALWKAPPAPRRWWLMGALWALLLVTN